MHKMSHQCGLPHLISEYWSAKSDTDDQMCSHLDCAVIVRSAFSEEVVTDTTTMSPVSEKYESSKEQKFLGANTREKENSRERKFQERKFHVANWPESTLPVRCRLQYH